MPIYQTAHYAIRPEGIDAVKAAITEFVDYVTANEPGTRLYTSWQQADDPTRFVHLFIFENADAHRAHGESEAVRAFESVYRPYLADGPVAFTGYVQLASNQVPAPRSG
jgi:quinol monooxygenase YgiN